jgi:hypothetical protein
MLVRKNEGKRPLGTPDIDGRTILKWTLNSGIRGNRLVHLAQDRE